MRFRAARARIPAFVAAIVAILTLIGALPAAAATVRVAGELRLGFKTSLRDQMAVDPSRHRGYYMARAGTPTLWVLDLKHLTVLAHAPMSLPEGPYAVDTIRHKIFFPEGSSFGGCASSRMWALDGVTLAERRIAMPCDRTVGPVTVDSMTMDAPLGILSVIGHRGASSVVRELTVREDVITLDWEVVAPGLCDTGGEPLLERMTHGTAAHCSAGGTGRAIWIPTWHGMPVPDAVGHAIVRVTGTGIVGDATALDRRTGRVAVASGDGTVAVYDAPDERRAATIHPPSAGEPLIWGTGSEHAFDPSTGRLYRLRGRVLDVADVRADAVAEAVRFEVPKGIPGRLSVDLRLHRIFVPLPYGLVAIEDDRPAFIPMADTGIDPRRSTSTTLEHILPRVASDAAFRVGIVPSAVSKMSASLAARPDPGSVISAGESERRDPNAAWFLFPTLPFLVMRRRYTRVLLRAPPVAA